MVTKEQIASGIRTVLAVCEIIRLKGSVPSGELYAELMGMMDLESYYKIVGILKSAGLVKESHHLLTYIGPQPEPLVALDFDSAEEEIKVVIPPALSGHPH